MWPTVGVRTWYGWQLATERNCRVISDRPTRCAAQIGTKLSAEHRKPRKHQLYGQEYCAENCLRKQRQLHALTNVHWKSTVQFHTNLY